MNTPNTDWNPDPNVIDEIVTELDALPEDGGLIVKDRDPVTGEEIHTEYTPSDLKRELYEGTPIAREIYQLHIREIPHDSQ